MDFITLHYFIEAAKDLNFTKTAKRLYTSQQNLSNHIAKMEEYYGVILFDRKPKISLTYAGHVLLEYANKERMAEDNLMNALKELKNESKGELHIGCSPNRTSALVFKVVDRFLNTYPNVDIHLYHMHSLPLWNKVANGELDFSVSMQQLDRPDISVTDLAEDHMLFLIKGNLLEKYFGNDVDSLSEKFSSGITIEEMAPIPLFVFSESKLIDRQFEKVGLIPNKKIVSNDPLFSSMKNYENHAATTMAFFNYQFMKNYISPDVFAFPILSEGKLINHTISLIRNTQKYLPPFGKHFQNLIINYFKNELPSDF